MWELIQMDQEGRSKREPASKLVKNIGEPTGIQRRNKGLRKCLKKWPKTKIRFRVQGWQR